MSVVVSSDLIQHVYISGDRGEFNEGTLKVLSRNDDVLAEYAVCVSERMMWRRVAWDRVWKEIDGLRTVFAGKVSVIGPGGCVMCSDKEKGAP